MSVNPDAAVSKGSADPQPRFARRNTAQTALRAFHRDGLWAWLHACCAGNLGISRRRRDSILLIFLWTSPYRRARFRSRFFLDIPEIFQCSWLRIAVLMPRLMERTLLTFCDRTDWRSGRQIAQRDLLHTKDPQFVVIDEVSGQLLTFFMPFTPSKLEILGCWVLYFFAIFDIWKPFPARQAESLPGGWGIMADDWVAGVYAAIGLWIARAAGL